ncbi:MAG: hypothetical protein CBARDMAM_2370 [uncultured Caballeronia sp.]|nr:MAG: hypothetical protein CBARDMAM_2370 [uncultured Caballeronia sp.]
MRRLIRVFSPIYFCHEAVLEACKRCGYGALMNFFRMLDTLLGLICKGSRPNFKQLIFEKKFRKNKKKFSRSFSLRLIIKMSR